MTRAQPPEDDAVRWGDLLRFWAPAIAIVGALTTGATAWARHDSRLSLVESELTTIRERGTETARHANQRADVLDDRVRALESQRAKTDEVLNRLDRRVALLLCRLDRSQCDRE